MVMRCIEGKNVKMGWNEHFFSIKVDKILLGLKFFAGATRSSNIHPKFLGGAAHPKSPAGRHLGGGFAELLSL